MNQHHDNDLKSIEKLTFGIGGVGELMQIIDYACVDGSALRRVGVLIESISNEVDKKISKIEE